MCLRELIRGSVKRTEIGSALLLDLHLPPASFTYLTLPTVWA